MFSIMRWLSRFSQTTPVVFIFFLTFHILLLTPVVHYNCLFAKTDPKGACACNCARCSARRADAHDLHQFDSETDSDKNPHNGCAIPGYTGATKSRSLGTPNISVENISCRCKKHAKSTVAEIKPFIPMLFFLVLAAPKFFKLISRYLLFYLEISLRPQPRPG